MFDEIICKAPLPFPEDIGELKDSKIIWNEEVFQTSDLDNAWQTYTIHEDGTLTFEEYDREWVESPTKGRKKHFFVIEGQDLNGHFKTKRQWTTTKAYHGEIFFYSNYYCKTKDYWIGFKARFTEGKLSNIELVEFKEGCNKKRLDTLNKLNIKLEESRKRSNKLWWKAYIVLYRTPVIWVCRAIYKTAVFISSNIYKLQHKLLPF